MRLLIALFLTIQLHSLTLQEAEIRALEVSPAIQLGNLESEQKDAQYAQAFLSWFPDISYGAMAALLQKPQKISHLQKQKHLFSNQFTLTQPIFSSSLLGNLKLSNLVKQGGRLGQEIAVNETLLAVRTSYLQFGIKSEEASLQQVRLVSLQKTFQDEEARLQSGTTTRLQVARAKAEISQEISKQLEYRKEAATAKRVLSMILRLSDQEEAHLTFGGFPSINEYPLLVEKQKLLQSYLSQNTLNPSPPATSLFSNEEILKMIITARARHPEIKKSSLYAQAADVKRAESRNQYFPVVSAFVDYGYYQPVNGQFFKQRNDWAGGIQLSWSLFDSLKREMRVREVGALRRAALLSFELENEKVEIMIKQDLRDIEEALFIYENSLENAFLAEQMAEEFEIQYASGSLSDLQLQEAKRFLADTEYNKTRAQAALLQKYYQLQHDIGKKD